MSNKANSKKNQPKADKEEAVIEPQETKQDELPVEETGPAEELPAPEENVEPIVEDLPKEEPVEAPAEPEVVLEGPSSELQDQPAEDIPDTEQVVELSPEALVEVPMQINTRKRFCIQTATFNETPTEGMQKFNALFNQNGETEIDDRNKVFAAIHDYISDRVIVSPELENAKDVCLERVSELYTLLQQYDGYFVKK